MTAAAVIHCAHCFMPTETTETGQAVDHDFPYAAYNYGQCKGSGKPTLAGPGTPPPVWGSDTGKTWLELGVMPSPVPTVEQDGWTVTITGVRFGHSAHCWKCRKVVHTTSEGGTIRFGFNAKGQAYEKLWAGGRAVFAGPCPNGCGSEQLSVQLSEHSARPLADGWTVQCREMERLRRDLDIWTPNMTAADLARLRPAAHRTARA